MDDHSSTIRTSATSARDSAGQPWVLYDYSCRQEAADLGKLDWSQLDYSKPRPLLSRHMHGAPRATRWITTKRTALLQNKKSRRSGNRRSGRNARTLPSPQLPNAPCPREPCQTGPRYVTTSTTGTWCADSAPKCTHILGRFGFVGVRKMKGSAWFQLQWQGNATCTSTLPSSLGCYRCRSPVRSVTNTK